MSNKLSLFTILLVAAHATTFGQKAPIQTPPSPSDKVVLESCTVSTANEVLDINNVEAVLQVSGDFWWDRGTGNKNYKVPKSSPTQPGVSSIHAGGFWLGGVDDGGNLKLAAQIFGAPSGSVDWWPGPLDTQQGITDFDYCTNFQ